MHSNTLWPYFMLYLVASKWMRINSVGHDYHENDRNNVNMHRKLATMKVCVRFTEMQMNWSHFEDWLNAMFIVRLWCNCWPELFWPAHTLCGGVAFCKNIAAIWIFFYIFSFCSRNKQSEEKERKKRPWRLNAKKVYKQCVTN